MLDKSLPTTWISGELIKRFNSPVFAKQKILNQQVIDYVTRPMTHHAPSIWKRQYRKPDGGLAYP